MPSGNTIKINGRQIIASGFVVFRPDETVEICDIDEVPGLRIHLIVKFDDGSGIGKTLSVPHETESDAVVITLTKSWIDRHSNLTANIGVGFAEDNEFGYYFTYQLQTIGPREKFIISANYTISRGAKS